MAWRRGRCRALAARAAGAGMRGGWAVRRAAGGMMRDMVRLGMKRTKYNGKHACDDIRDQFAINHVGHGDAKRRLISFGYVLYLAAPQH